MHAFDRQTDEHLTDRSSPRWHSMQRGKKTTKSSATAEIEPIGSHYGV